MLQPRGTTGVVKVLRPPGWILLLAPRGDVAATEGRIFYKGQIAETTTNGATRPAMLRQPPLFLLQAAMVGARRRRPVEAQVRPWCD